MNIDPTVIQFLLPVAAAAAAWGGSRQALNGTRERVKSIDEKLEKHITQVHTDIAQRLAVVEVKVDSQREYLTEHINRAEHNGVD